jgi:hypothetical protein
LVATNLFRLVKVHLVCLRGCMESPDASNVVHITSLPRTFNRLIRQGMWYQ